jgi:colicin import membrane protein
MASRSLSYAIEGNNQPFLGAIGISLVAHFMLVALALFSPVWDSDPEFIPSVIDVQMVDLSDLNAAPVKKEAAAKEKAPVVKEKEAEVEVAPKPVPKAEATKEPEVSVAPPQKKSSKSALKYKTFKSKKVIKNALKRVEKKVGSSPPKPLEDTLKKLREKVAKEGRPGPSGDSPKQGDQVGKSSVYGRGSKREIELIDLYRVEIAYTIQKNWAFAEQLSGGGKRTMVSIVFKVMPDGSITDVFFTDRSGNQYLDDSAYRAIVKSSPVKPHPDKLSLPYVEMGLRFTPEGVQ